MTLDLRVGSGEGLQYGAYLIIARFELNSNHFNKTKCVCIVDQSVNCVCVDLIMRVRCYALVLLCVLTGAD